MAEVATEAVEIDHTEMRAFAGVQPQLSVEFEHQSSLPSCPCLNTRRFARPLVYALLTVTCMPLVAGAAFTSIFVEDGNYNAAVVAFFTTCVSAACAWLFVLHLLRRLQEYHDASSLESIKVFSMLLSVASGVALGAYSILAFLNHQEFSFNGLNYFSSAVFSLLCLASSIELYIVAQWYQNFVQISAGKMRVTSLRQSTQAVN